MPAATAAQQTPLVNVAQGRIATQSTTGLGADAARAVDGWTSGNFYYNTVTHTYGGSNLWWQVDLGAVYPIDTIDLWNRTDCCSDRLNDFYVFVSDVPFPSNDLGQITSNPTVSSFFTSGPASERTTITANRTGRYVRVALKNPGFLSLAEVQVWSSGTPVARAARDPYTAVVPGDGQMLVGWYTVAGAASYSVARARASDGIFTTLATGLAATPGQTILTSSDSGLVNDTFYIYRVTAFSSAGQLLSTSEDVYGKPSATTGFNTTAPLAATGFTARAGVNVVQDSVLGRNVIGNINNSGYIAFGNTNFNPLPNGVSLRYRGGANTSGYLQFLTFPGGLVATVPVTNTYGAWTDTNGMVFNAAGQVFLQVMFVGQGGEDLAIDQFSFSTPGPYDTATVKWDPNIVLLHKSMGIALDNYALDQSDMTMLLQFSTTTAQGRGQFAKLKAGSVIASDTNLDLGGPYARVTQVVSINDSQVAVKAAALAFNDLIYAGSFDASAAIQQSVNAAMEAAVGTSAKGPAFNTAGYDTSFPSDITYYNGSDLTSSQGGGSQSYRQTRTAGVGSQAAQSSTPGAPTVLPPEAKNSPKGTFHVTMDNAQFVKDENGWGIELINVKMNGLGIQPLPSGPPGSNPTAAQFGFGVLGGVGADKLMIQAKVEVDKGVISRNEMFSVKTQITGTAHFQAKGLAVALWFWEVPLKWVKPIRFVVPTAVGPIPCSIGFGVQGFIMAVGAGNMVAEKGYQVKFTQGGPPGKEIQVSDYGETKLEFGQRADNLSLMGVFFEPFIKVRVGTFGLEEADPAVVAQLLGWFSHWVKITPEQLKKMEGFFVFTFTPRVYYLMLLQNWKDRDRPIHEQKVCVGPIVKAEALPGFPLPITFELRLEGPPYCFSHETWLQYDMRVPEGVLIDPSTGKGKATWGVPILSEHSRIPYDIKFAGAFPYSEPGGPQVLSTNIADAWFNAAERRRCVVFRKPLNASDTVDIAYSGPCQSSLTTEVQLPANTTDSTFLLRVLTEYRNPTTLSDAAMIKNEYAGGGGLPWGIWSDKPFQVVRPNDTTAFKVNATEVFSNSAQTMKPIEGTECDPEALRALGMTLDAQIAVVDPTLTKLVDVSLEVDGLAIATSYPESSTTRWRLTTAPMNLASGTHTMTIVAKEQMLGSGATYTVRYSATFKVQAKSCGRAKADDLNALIFEGSRCARQDTPEVTLDVLNNDDWTGGAELSITAVSAAKLGTVRVGTNGQNLRYKAKSVGVDSFVYTITVTTTTTTPPTTKVETAKANVLVTNKLASTDAECTGAGGGGSGGNGSKSRGKAGGWGDPHLFTADRVAFDSHALGEFTYLRPKAGQSGVILQGRQELVYADKFPAMTTALAVKVGDHVIEVRGKKTPRFLLDGVGFNDKYADLGGGTSLTVSGDTVTLRGANTTLNLLIGSGGWINFDIDVPQNDTLEGLLGTPNENPADDLRLPDGTLITGTRPDYFILADGWRISNRTLSLFTYGSGEGPETYNKENPYRNNIPDDTTLAPYKTQARTLLTNTCDSTGLTPDERRVDDLALELFIGMPPSSVAMYLCSYEISGRITSTNPAGAPVAGASVAMSSSQLNPCTAITDAEGRYRCKLSPIPNTTAAPSVSVTVSGGTTTTVAFPTRAPLSGTLTRTLDLAVTRPTVRLTVRSFDANTNAPTANAPIAVYSNGVRQRITTSPTGTATLVLSYQPGTTTATVQATGVAPAYGNAPYNSVTLNQNGPVDLMLDVKHIVLSTPAWSVSGIPGATSMQTFQPIVSGTSAAIAPNGTVYTLASLYDSANPSKSYRLLATSASGARVWLSPFAFATQKNNAPVVGPDGTIYVLAEGGSNGMLYAFNPADGSLKWTFTAPQPYVSARPAVAADGTLYLVTGPYSGAPTLYAVSPATGTAVWSYLLPDGSTSNPVVGADGTIYVAGNVLRAFNPNGTLKGATTFSVRSDARILIGADGALFLVAGYVPEGPSESTMAINPNLTLRWNKGYGSGMGGTIGPDGGVYVQGYTTGGPGLLKLDPLTGTALWTSTLSVERAPVIAADGMLYVLNRVVVSGVVDYYEVVGLRGSDGVALSRFNLRSLYSTALAMAPNGQIITGVNSSNGTDLWSVPTSSTTGPAAGWSSVYGNAQNTGRRNP
ncbi:MAG TPA: PQQ-binding-like beta-propeller repeat protein [Roseiflexaceae bacterium]|nr:PQQ-binding-like beta-propeller repeat protein [Roseiflexaceae bacterium]